MSRPTPDQARAILTNLASEGRSAERKAWLVFEAEYDRRGTAERELESRLDGQAWAGLIAANERMGKALTAIGLALGLPQPSARLHWGAPEILRRISAQQAECERLHPAVGTGTDEAAEPVFCEAAAEWDHTWVVIEGVEQCSECHMGAAAAARSTNRSYWTSADTWRDPDCIECGGEGAPCCEPPNTPPPGGEPVENDFTEPLLPMLGRISDAAGITLGGPHWEGEVTHLVAYGRLWQQIRYRFPDEVGDLHRRFAASPGADTPAEPTGSAALLALCDALDRLPASEGASGPTVAVDEIRRLLRAQSTPGPQVFNCEQSPHPPAQCPRCEPIAGAS